MASLKQRFFVTPLANADNVTSGSQAYGSVSTAKKTGTGGATLSPSGNYTGANNKLVTVQIDTLGTGEIGSSTYRWKTSDSSGWEATGQTTSASTVSLGSEGIEFTFAAYAGGADFVLNDKWQWWVYSTFSPANLFTNDRDLFWKSASLSDNLLLNADFEDGFTGGLADRWTKAEATQTYADETGTVHTGSHAQKITCVDDSDAIGIYQAETIASGDEYYIEAWVYCSNASYFTFQCANLDNNDAHPVTISAADTWQKCTWYPTGTGSGAADVYFIQTADDCTTSDYLILDDIRMVALPYLDFDLGSALEIDTIALLDHNFSGNAVIKLKGDDTEDWVSPAYAKSDFTIADDPIIEYDGDTLQYWRWVFQDINNADDYISVGKLYLGTYTEVSDGELYGGANYGSANTQRSFEEQNQAITGKETFRVFADRQEFPLDYTWLTSTELATLKTVWDFCRDVSTGTKTAIFLHYWYDTNSTLYFVYCVSDWSPSYPRGGFSLTLEWRESVITRTI